MVLVLVKRWLIGPKTGKNIQWVEENVSSTSEFRAQTGLGSNKGNTSWKKNWLQSILQKKNYQTFRHLLWTRYKQGVLIFKMQILSHCCFTALHFTLSPSQHFDPNLVVESFIVALSSSFGLHHFHSLATRVAIVWQGHIAQSVQSGDSSLLC